MGVADALALFCCCCCDSLLGAEVVVVVMGVVAAAAEPPFFPSSEDGRGFRDDDDDEVEGPGCRLSWAVVDEGFACRVDLLASPSSLRSGAASKRSESMSLSSA